MWLSRDTMAGQDRCSPTAEEGGLASKVIPHLQGDENITLGETPELQVVIDSEARLVERTPQEKHTVKNSCSFYSIKGNYVYC